MDIYFTINYQLPTFLQTSPQNIRAARYPLLFELRGEQRDPLYNLTPLRNATRQPRSENCEIPDE